MTPYTYLIGWKDQEKYYYGVRFAKGCEPKDLWVTNQKQERLVTQIPQGWKVGRLPHGRKPSENFVHNKPHTPETKRLISQRKKGVSIDRSHVDISGEKNPMYGRMWVTNGSINKTILKHELIPEGFTKGKLHNGG